MPEHLPEREEKYLTEQEVRAIISSSMSNMGMFGGGAGSEVFKFDRKKGIWLGNAKFEDAPFRVTMKGAITGASLTLSQISDAGDLAALDQVDTAQIVANAVNTTKLALLSVTDAVLASNAVTASKIVTGAVTSTKINVGTLSAISANCGTITAGTITSAVVRTDSGTYPHAIMNSGGFVVNGQYMTIRRSNGTLGGELFASSANGLILSSFSGEQCYINGANNLVLNAGGGTLQLRHGNTTRAYTSSNSLIISSGMTLGGTRRTTWPSGGVSDHGSLTGVTANQHHSSTSSGIAINPSGVSSNGNVAPSSSNTRYCGTSGAYWHRVYSDAYFTKNTTFQTFDKYDDLQILRDLKFDKKGKLKLNNLPKEIHDKGFINFGGMASFNLCASRKIVECVDDLKKTIDILTNRLNKLERKTI